MLDSITQMDPRYLGVGIAAAVIFLVLVSFGLRHLRTARRDRYAKLLIDKMEGAVKRAESVILEAEARALNQGGRDDKRPFDFVNWFAIRRDLKKAGFPTFPILVFAGAGALATAIAYFIVAAPIYPLWAVALAIYMPCFFVVRRGILGMRIEKRRMTTLVQLVRFIESVQRAVAVGTSPDEAVNEAIRDSENPLRENLDSIRELLELGYDFVDAINLAADRMNMPEFDIFVASLSAQANSGGSIGDVLREVVDITRSRMDLQTKIGTMTAEGRFNAGLLGALPILLSVYLRTSQADYFDIMWSSTAGVITFFMTLGAAVIGFWLALKIASVKV